MELIDKLLQFQLNFWTDHSDPESQREWKGCSKYTKIVPLKKFPHTLLSRGGCLKYAGQNDNRGNA